MENNNNVIGGRKRAFNNHLNVVTVMQQTVVCRFDVFLVVYTSVFCRSRAKSVTAQHRQWFVEFLLI
jgi:hypothetical protein